MRNPIRLKNLRSRYIPYYLLGLVLLQWVRPSPTAFWLGFGAVLAGAGLRTWGAGHLVKTDRLTVSGPYAHLRHPLYAGTLAIASGFAVIASGPIGAGILLAMLPWFFFHYFPRKERAESERLAARHGDVYERYRAAVPALLPSITPWHPSAADAVAVGEPARWSLDRYSDNNELGTLLAVLLAVVIFAQRTWLAAG